MDTDEKSISKLLVSYRALADDFPMAQALLGAQVAPSWRPRWYVVGRRARRAGHFHEELLGLRGTWRPVGSYAVAVLTRIPPKPVIADPDHPIAQYFIDTDLHHAAAYWHHVIEAMTKGAVAPAELFLRFRRIRWLPPIASRGQMVQGFLLHDAPKAALLSLSALFGLTSGRLWKCQKCQRLFIRATDRLNQRTCDVCAEAGPRRYATRFSASLMLMWTRVRQRLNLRVHRETMSRADRDQVLSEAWNKLEAVREGQLTEQEWWKRWGEGTRLRPGRKAPHLAQPLTPEFVAKLRSARQSESALHRGTMALQAMMDNLKSRLEKNEISQEDFNRQWSEYQVELQREQNRAATSGIPRLPRRPRKRR